MRIGLAFDLETKIIDRFRKKSLYKKISVLVMELHLDIDFKSTCKT